MQTAWEVRRTLACVTDNLRDRGDRIGPRGFVGYILPSGHCICDESRARDGQSAMHAVWRVGDACSGSKAAGYRARSGACYSLTRCVLTSFSPAKALTP